MLDNHLFISQSYNKTNTKTLKKLFINIFNKLKKNKYNFFNLYFNTFDNSKNIKNNNVKFLNENKNFLCNQEQDKRIDYQTDLIFFYEKIFFKNFLKKEYLFNIKQMFYEVIQKNKKEFIDIKLYNLKLYNFKNLCNNNYKFFFNEIKYILFKIYILLNNNNFLFKLNKKKLSIFKFESKILKNLDQLDASDKDKIIKIYNKDNCFKDIVSKDYLYNTNTILLIKKNSEYFFEEIKSINIFLKNNIIFYMKSNYKFCDKKYYNKYFFSNKNKKIYNKKTESKDYVLLDLDYNFEFYYNKEYKSYIFTIYKKYNLEVYSIILNLGNLSLDLLLVITNNLKKRNIININNIIQSNCLIELLDEFIHYYDYK